MDLITTNQASNTDKIFIYADLIINTHFYSTSSTDEPLGSPDTGGEESATADGAIESL